MATGETGFDDVTFDLISVQYHSPKAGHDYGQTLYTMGVLGWLMLPTLPAGGIAGLLWLVLLLLHHSRWKRRDVAAEANT